MVNNWLATGVSPRLELEHSVNDIRGKADRANTDIRLRRTRKFEYNWTIGKMVPGGGFEPPTRGFSIRCSTN